MMFHRGAVERAEPLSKGKGLRVHGEKHEDSSDKQE